MHHIVEFSFIVNLLNYPHQGGCVYPTFVCLLVTSCKNYFMKTLLVIYPWTRESPLNFESCSDSVV